MLVAQAFFDSIEHRLPFRGESPEDEHRPGSDGVDDRADFLVLEVQIDELGERLPNDCRRGVAFLLHYDDPPRADPYARWRDRESPSTYVDLSEWVKGEVEAA